MLAVVAEHLDTANTGEAPVEDSWEVVLVEQVMLIPEVAEVAGYLPVVLQAEPVVQV
jgi:hypothetical protein